MFDQKTAESLEKAAENLRSSWTVPKGTQTIFGPLEKLPVDEASLKDVTPKFFLS